MRLNSEYNGDQFKPFQNHAKTLLVSSDGPASRFAAPAGGAHFFMRDRFNKHRRGAPCRIVVRCAREMAATSSCPRYCGAAPHTPRASAKSSTVIDGIRPRKSGSHQTHRWREPDSKSWSLSRMTDIILWRRIDLPGHEVGRLQRRADRREPPAALAGPP